MNRKILVTVILIFSTASVFSQLFHEQMDSRFSLFLTDPPNLYNEYFAGAGACMMCHNSQVDEAGNSIAILNDWRSTMMGNAARDPFWKAKISHETLVNPHLKTEIETV